MNIKNAVSLLMILSIGKAVDASALPWSLEEILELREAVVGHLESEPYFGTRAFKERILGGDNWFDCWKIFDDAKENGWMDNEDIAIWIEAKAAPLFTKRGDFIGISRLCGP